jgi:hypothetical protein
MTQIQQATFQDTVMRLQQTMDNARNEAKQAFLSELKGIFARHPEIKVITWVQYTPYFNDGDECVFRVSDVYAANYEDINHYGEWDSEDDEPADLQTFTGYRRHSRIQDLDDLVHFMDSPLGEEVLQFAFGDHVSIRVTASGVTVDDYDHE